MKDYRFLKQEVEREQYKEKKRQEEEKEKRRRELAAQLHEEDVRNNQLREAAVSYFQKYESVMAGMLIGRVEQQVEKDVKQFYQTGKLQPGMERRTRLFAPKEYHYTRTLENTCFRVLEASVWETTPAESFGFIYEKSYGGKRITRCFYFPDNNFLSSLLQRAEASLKEQGIVLRPVNIRNGIFQRPDNSDQAKKAADFSADFDTNAFFDRLFFNNGFNRPGKDTQKASIFDMKEAWLEIDADLGIL